MASGTGTQYKVGMKFGEPRPEQTLQIEAITNELQQLDASMYPNLCNLADNGNFNSYPNKIELFRLQGGVADTIDLISNKQIKVRAKISLPQSTSPGMNFVGKILGPGGQNIRSMQDTTGTKMAILGSGSLRDENREKELLASGEPKFQHFKQGLHLQVDSLAAPSDAYYSISCALTELRKALYPVNITSINIHRNPMNLNNHTVDLSIKLLLHRVTEEDRFVVGTREALKCGHLLDTEDAEVPGLIVVGLPVIRRWPRWSKLIRTIHMEQIP